VEGVTERNPAAVKSCSFCWREWHPVMRRVRNRKGKNFFIARVGG